MSRFNLLFVVGLVVAVSASAQLLPQLPETRTPVALVAATEVAAVIEQAATRVE